VSVSKEYADAIGIYAEVMRRAASKQSASERMKALYNFVQLVALGVLGACATTAPFDYPQTPSTALEDTDDG
jgi:hypothetical protein